MKKILIYLSFGTVVALLSYELYGLNLESQRAKADFSNLNSEKQALAKDNEVLQADIKYFSDPHNLEKELRARFNVRLPGEKLIIVVPPTEKTQ